MINPLSNSLVFISFGAFLLSCASVTGVSNSSPPSAMAHLKIAPGHDFDGTVYFTETEDGLAAIARVKGLKAESIHGLHIHENGNCDLPDFKSAGGHYNPHDQKHGAPSGETSHVGDMGNLVANQKGEAKNELFLKKATLTGEDSVLGKAVVLHEDPDDLVSQPSGDAGGRIGCGIIVKVDSVPRHL